MDKVFAWVQMAWDRIGGWPGLLTFVVLYALAATMFVHLLKFSDWLSRRRQETRDRKAQQCIIAEAQAVATAEGKRLALKYDVDAAIVAAERILRARRGDDEQEARL